MKDARLKRLGILKPHRHPRCPLKDAALQRGQERKSFLPSHGASGGRKRQRGTRAEVGQEPKRGVKLNTLAIDKI
jgi:hypothetical protein